jgi:hypothetical protein
MRRIYAYFISLLVLLTANLSRGVAQDTLSFPLNTKIGLDISGPVIYLTDNNIFNVEGYISVDINEKISVALGTGYLDYSYSQYNYEYLSKGIYFRPGIDFNLLKPAKSTGRYWVGLGIRYGISSFSSDIPLLKQENYWGTFTSYVGNKRYLGHFFEISPGVRAELFRNFSMGWNVSLRLLVHCNSGEDLKPVMIPGFGDGSRKINPGIHYFVVWNIPYRKIHVITKPTQTVEEAE